MRPVGALCELDGDALALTVFGGGEDGSGAAARIRHRGPAADPEAAGRGAAEALAAAE
jgi:hypothetical protein